MEKSIYSADLWGARPVVNVASVPQRSPFRYPGGKTWLIPYIRLWFQQMTDKPALLVEPFAGGGIVSLTAVFECLVDRALMVELDDRVASVWETIIGRETDRLIERIRTFSMTKANVLDALSRAPETIYEAAFQAILQNRTNHGGIMAPGAGLIQSGENGKGIGSRWYPKTLCRRIQDIKVLRERLEFNRGDGIAAIREYRDNPDAAFFVDPPYSAAGKKAGRRLYTHNQIDHELLFATMQGVRGNFLMTYDDCVELRHMAVSYGFDYESIPMKNTHNARMNELLIARELDWVRVA